MLKERQLTLTCGYCGERWQADDTEMRRIQNNMALQQRGC
jgi:hypothetical protein